MKSTYMILKRTILTLVVISGIYLFILAMLPLAGLFFIYISIFTAVKRLPNHLAFSQLLNNVKQ